MTPVDSLFERDFGQIAQKTQDCSLLPRKPRHHVPLPVNPLSHHLPPIINTPRQQKANTNSEVLPRHYIISRIFYPLVLVGKFVGICPITTVKTGEKNNLCIHYQFCGLSLPVLHTVGMVSFNLFVLTYWTFNSVLNVDGPFGLRIFAIPDQEENWINERFFNGSQVISTVNKLTKLTLPLGAWILYTLQSIDISVFCLFVNDWSVFLRDYEFSFSSYHTHTFNRSLKLRLYIFSALWLIPILSLLCSVQPIDYFASLQIPTLGYVFGYTQIIYIAGTRGLSYLRDMMLLRTLSKAYEEILLGMQAEYKKCGENISKAQVTAWLDLINFVRKQAARVEKFIGLPNLWSIFEVFISLLLMLSMVIFLFMSNQLQGYGANFLPYTLIYTSFFTGSLYWKTRLAERITEAEDAIAEEVVEMDTRDDNYEARLEMKLICDLINKDPVRIRVGNMFTLNKRLLLAFFSQLAAYLIVILQFAKP